MPRMPDALREERLGVTKQKLLDAAAAEFAENGFAGANINRISLSAGFAKGTIYNYFPSKRALMLALIDEIAALHTSFILEQVKSETEPVKRLHQFFSAGFAFVREHPLPARIAINAAFSHDNEFRERIYDAYMELFTAISARILEAGVQTGAFKPMNIDATMAMIMSLYLGSSSLVDERGEVWSDAESVTAFVVEGLRQP